MMQPSLVIGGSSSGGGAASGALVRKRILSVDGGRTFVKITESLGEMADFGQYLLDKAIAEYEGPLTLTKEIVNFRCCLIGGAGGGETTDGARSAWGGWPGGVFLFDGRLSDIPAGIYVFVGAGGQGGYIPDPENAEWETGNPGSGSSSQFYLWDPVGNNHPEGGGGFPGGGTDGDAAQKTSWQYMTMYYDLRMPDPTLMDFNGMWGNQSGPGPGAPLLNGGRGGTNGGYAYLADPLRRTEANFGNGVNGASPPDVFGACGSGGSSSYAGTVKGGNGGAPGGGGAGAFGGLNGGDGANGEIHIELNLWEIA